jgi:hypothetical protein
MATENEVKRAQLMIDIKTMTFRQGVDELQKMKNKTSKYGRAPQVIIDEWIEKANSDNTSLYRWIMRQFITEPPPRPPKRLHDENQLPIQELFGVSPVVIKDGSKS